MTVNHILVDACIAKAVGDPVREPAYNSKRVVDELSSGPTGLAMTDLLLAEWRKHWSNYIRAWYVKMVSRDRVRHLKDRRLADYRRACDRMSNAGEVAALRKDAHLVEAAIRYQLAVISTDDKQRKLLTRVSVDYGLVAMVQWINPNVDCSSCMDWLRVGAVDRAFSTIGSVDT